MRFSYLISAFLASLAIASPIFSPEAVERDLAIRAEDVNTDEWEFANKIQSGLKKDDWVWFTQEWLRGTVGDGDTESEKEISDLRNDLGFDHIGIIIGKITESTSGTGSSKVTTHGFKASMYHMISNKGKAKPAEVPKWKVPDASKYTVKWGGKTKEKKVTAAKKVAQKSCEYTHLI